MRLLVFFLIFIFFNANLLSQKKLKGKYCSYQYPDYSACFDLKGNKFSYETAGDIGIINYGSGTFKIKNDKILFNFKRIKPKKSESHFNIEKIKTNTNNTINLTIMDLKGNPVTIGFASIDEKKSWKWANDIGRLQLKPKNLGQKKTLVISALAYEEIHLKIRSGYDYYIKVCLAENGGKGKPTSLTQLSIPLKEFRKDYKKVNP